MQNNYLKKAACAILLFNAFALNVADAVTLDYTVDVSSVYSDNIDRQPDDGLDELIVSPGLEFDIASTGGKFYGDARGDIRYLDYTKDTYGNETLGSFGGTATWSLIPETLSWHFEDNYGQIIANPFQAITPGNREDINYFTTGPDYRSRIGGANSFLVGGRYSNEWYEDSPTNNNQYSGYVALSRGLSSGRTLGLYARASRVEYDKSMINSNYDVQSISAQFESATSRSDLLVNVGATQLHDNNDKTTDALFELSYTRTLGGASSLALTASSKFDETGQAFRADQGGSAIVQGTRNVIAGGEPFRHKGATIDYRYRAERFSFGLGSGWTDDSYENDDTFDRRIVSARLTLGYEFSSAASINLTSAYSKMDYGTVDQTDKDSFATLDFSQQLSRNISVIVGYSYFTRNSNVGTENYDENRGTLRLEYSR